MTTMTPTMTPSNDLPVRLREYNRWQRGDELLEQMHIADIGEMLDEAADRLEELERELVAERAVAVNLAALAAWKEARRV